MGRALLLSLLATAVVTQDAHGAPDCKRLLTDLVDPRGAANDMNGDGKFDLSDCVYGLQYLFAGGPAPCPLVLDPQLPVCDQCCGGETCRGKLPATGQTVCWDTNHQPQDCEFVDLPGQDGFHRAGCPTQGRFVDNGDGTVTDTCTGLMWQQESPAATMVWADAIRFCEDRSIGYADWRLPNVRELQSIVDYSKFSPAIDGSKFPATAAGNYWSSTALVFSPGNAWAVDFANGIVTYAGWGAQYYVRAVRNAQECRGPLPSTGLTWCYSKNAFPVDCSMTEPPHKDSENNIPRQDGFYASGCPLEGRFLDNADGTVTDMCTKLVWQQETASPPLEFDPEGDKLLSWADALKYCEGLGAGWRLPNVRELQSIVDYGQVYPSVTKQFFTCLNGNYWTSTTVASSSTEAWYVDFYTSNGYAGVTSKAGGLYVRAVRDSE